MKFSFRARSLIVVFVVALVSVAAKEAPVNPEWRARMQGLLTDVLALFPYAFDEAQFNDPKNASKIKASLENLSQHSSGLKKHTARISKEEGLKLDPAFPFIAEAFENEIKSAAEAFAAGPASYPQAQGYLRAGLAKCTVCHSQSSTGPELKLESFKSQFAALPTKDRFMALAATRQFDEALNEFSKSLRESKVKKPDQYFLDREIKAAFAIAVRVRRDPKRTLALIEEISASGSSSTILQNDLKDWKKDTLTWMNEKPAVLDNDKALFQEAQRLIAASSKRDVSVDHFENASIPLLRASTHLHDLLANYPKSEFRAEAYVLLASTYDSLPGFAIWDLADEYLGACIQENPHSKVAERCFEKYKTSMVLGYSGSSGTHIPPSVRQHLQRLQELAAPEVKKKKK
jgi:hypothetical protein